MYIGVLLFPLIGSICVGFFGRFIGEKGAHLLSISFIGLTLLTSLVAFKEVCLGGSVVVIDLFNWFSVGVLDFSWCFLFDTVTCVMLVVITSISFLVHLYSTSYMEGDPHTIRFMSYLSLFTFFMIMMVVSGNYAQLFLGWEGVGLSSYLLINFWFTRVQANKAAIKAIVINRFGDFGLMFGLMLLICTFNSLDFAIIFSLADSLNEVYVQFFIWEVHAISLIVFFLFLGCVGKSAQLGLHTWLPDAMEGPTPVSALIHAATMVTAGVFLLIRSSILLDYSIDCLVLITIVGSLTAFFAGTVGIFQNDLKRVIAYSTCSQLGYMVFSCGLSNYSVSMFHLSNHAFFKALLFLSAGSVIHAVADEQDIRRMGGLIKLLPMTYSAFLIGSLALMGFPYTTGFYSKDVILELSFANYYFEGLFSYWLGVLAAGCTAFYSVRLLYFTFLSETNSSKGVIKQVHDSPIRMALPLIILSLGSIFIGYFSKDMFIGVGTNFWGNSLGVYNSLSDELMLEAEFLPAWVKLLPVIFSLIMALFAYYLYESDHKFSLYLGYNNYKYAFARDIYSFFNHKWYFDHIYNTFVTRKILGFAYNTSFKVLDRGFIELMGPTGLVRGTKIFSGAITSLQSGFIFNYVFVMILSLFSFLFLLQLLNTYVVGQLMCFSFLTVLLYSYLLRKGR